jgi:hypothetical protein
VSLSFVASFLNCASADLRCVSSVYSALIVHTILYHRKEIANAFRLAYKVRPSSLSALDGKEKLHLLLIDATHWHTFADAFCFDFCSPYELERRETHPSRTTTTSLCPDTPKSPSGRT